MCKGNNPARSKRMGRGSGWVWRLSALAILFSLATSPVRAQPAQLPPPNGIVAAPPLAPAAGPIGLAAPAPAEKDPWEFFVSTGPIFPIGGRIASHLNPGWTIEFGARQPICGGGGNSLFFTELGGAYTTIPGNSAVQETGVHVFLPDGSGVQLINDFNVTRLIEIHEGSMQWAFGWSSYPAMLNQSGDRQVFLTGRIGARAGGFHAIYNEFATPAGIEFLNALQNLHGNPSHNPALISISDKVKSDEFFAGIFASIGIGVTWNDVQMGKLRFGEVKLGAEVQFENDWLDLGEFVEPQGQLFQISPRLTLSFAF